MDPVAALAAFNQQIRRPAADDVGYGRIEREGPVIRCLAHQNGWNGVLWSDLDEATADEVIADQVTRFAGLGEWEWKHYSYDQPADLPARLEAAGLTRKPSEALMVADVSKLALDTAAPDGVEVREVVDQAGVAVLVALHDEVFGGDHAGLGSALVAQLRTQPPTAAAFVAWAGQEPVCAGRVEFHPGTDFASIWGGGTLPEWRGRGVFRSLVARRAAVAAARGFRYLQVDAAPASRPILERLGFVELATTTPFVHPG
jgi:GNAT superfamily N-acetyltransferase